ncbi:hypothetical protein D3C71_2121580 [compost metagenome]
MRGARCRNDFGDAFLLDFHKQLRGDGLDFRHHQVRPFFFDNVPQRGGISHRDHVGTMRNLHAGRVRIAVDSNDFDAKPL